MAIVKKRSFWDRVEEAMRDAGHKPTQKAVADLTGIEQPSVHKWTKTGKPKMEHVIVLASKLRVCVEWLYTERGPKHPMDPETSALLDLFASIKSQRQRDRALAYLEGLAERGSESPEPLPPEPRPRPRVS